MKKIMYIAAALLVLVGCQKSQEAKENAPANYGTITGKIELPQGPNKIVAPEGWADKSEAFTMVWESTDQIYIYGHGQCKPLSVKSIDTETGIATFEGELLSDMSSYIVDCGYNPLELSTIFSVDYIAGNYRPIAHGEGAGYTFTIDDFGPVIGLQLKGTDALSKIEVVLSDGSRKILDTYTMTFAEALALDASTATKVYFRFFQFEGDEAEMAINFYKKESSADVLIMTKTTTHIPAAGKVTTFPELTVQAPPTKMVNGHKGVQLWENGPYWATMNVGASTPEGYGDYFAWGETEPYYSSLNPLTWKEGKGAGYYWLSYKHCTYTDNPTLLTINKYYFDYKGDIDWITGTVDDKTTLEPEDDAATANWGDTWRMPTKAEWEELNNPDNCTLEWKENYYNTGVSGYLVTSKVNVNSIFLPAAGNYSDKYLLQKNSGSCYWSSSLVEKDSNRDPSFAYYLWINDKSYIAARSDGNSIRPVCN